MVQPVARKPGRFTYSDYLGWPEDERWELIGGEAWAMSPSPGEAHQRVAGVFFVELYLYFQDKSCRVYSAPFDVVLSEQDVVQPDVLVVCDPSKITSRHVAGSPDLVVEVLSPSTAPKDRREKLQLYQTHGVREYLIVHAEEGYVEQFVLGSDGRYAEPAIVSAEETYRSAFFPGLEIGLSRVFAR